jgi:type I restriction-modification system DNA methylase subunit
MLWDAACSIRGEKDAPKFKDYLLPLLFIKRLSDVFDDEIQRLSETYGDRKTALEILENDHKLVRFYIPPEARWPVVSNREPFKWPRGKEPKSLGEQLTTTIRAIVKHNPSLAGVIDIVDYNETRNGEREISDEAIARLCVNGIPVKLDETKSARKEEGIDEGVEQVRRYHRETPELLSQSRNCWIGRSAAGQTGTR